MDLGWITVSDLLRWSLSHLFASTEIDDDVRFDDHEEMTPFCLIKTWSVHPTRKSASDTRAFVLVVKSLVENKELS